MIPIIRYFHGETAADTYAALRAKALAGPPAPPAPPRTKSAPPARVVKKWFESYTETFLFPLLKDLLGKQKDRIASLEAEIETLRSRPLMKLAGTFVPGARYAEASICTHQARCGVRRKRRRHTWPLPGNSWRLIVKRGAHS